MGDHQRQLHRPVTTPATLPSDDAAAENAAAAITCPPGVLRGAKCEGITIDWARLSGPRENFAALNRHLTKHYGQGQRCNGRFFLGCGFTWPGGAAAFFDNHADEGKPAKPHMVVELPGAFLAGLLPTARIALLRELRELGFKCTRLDIAADWRGERIELIDAMIRACEAGELCGAKRWSPVRQFSGPELVAHMVTIGARGKSGSGRYLRGYDKGLQTGTEARGVWVRLELELADDCAEQALVQLCGVQAWERVAASILFGAVDFRGVTGDKHIEARPRMAWWAQIIEGIATLRVRARRRLVTLEGWAAWMRKAVAAPLATHGKELGLTAAEMFQWVVGDDVQPSRGARHSVVGHQLRCLLGFERESLPRSPGSLAVVLGGAA